MFIVENLANKRVYRQVLGQVVDIVFNKVLDIYGLSQLLDHVKDQVKDQVKNKVWIKIMWILIQNQDLDRYKDNKMNNTLYKNIINQLKGNCVVK